VVCVEEREELSKVFLRDLESVVKEYLEELFKSKTSISIVVSNLENSSDANKAS